MCRLRKLVQEKIAEVQGSLEYLETWRNRVAMLGMLQIFVSNDSSSWFTSKTKINKRPELLVRTGS